MVAEVAIGDIIYAGEGRLVIVVVKVYFSGVGVAYIAI
jgi:hypothetical protein